MSNSGKRMQKLKKQFGALERKGKKDDTRSLSDEEVAYVVQVLKYPVAPCLYEIETRRFENVSGAARILLEIHRAHRHGDPIIYKDLGSKDKAALTKAGVPFRPVKYRIVLNAK